VPVGVLAFWLSDFLAFWLSGLLQFARRAFFRKARSRSCVLGVVCLTEFL
jgi:hypothetical protein